MLLEKFFFLFKVIEFLANNAFIWMCEGQNERTYDFLASYAVVASSLLPPFAKTCKYKAQNSIHVRCGLDLLYLFYYSLQTSNIYSDVKHNLKYDGKCCI